MAGDIRHPSRRSPVAARVSEAPGPEPDGRGVGQPPSAPAQWMLGLQRSVGNRGVAELVDAARATGLPLAGGEPVAGAHLHRPEVLTVQRDLTITWDDVNQTRVPGAQGTKIFGKLLDALRDYHNNKRNARAFTKELNDVETHCRDYLKAQAQVPGSAARADVRKVAELLNQAEADLNRALTPAPVAPGAILKATLGTAPAELTPRLLWMREVAKATDASVAEKAALPQVKAALAQYNLIRARQEASLRAQQGQASGQPRYLDRPAGEGGALSELLRSLFATFAARPHGFPSATTVEQFGRSVRDAVRALRIDHDTRRYSNFDDVEVILSGSAVTGRALVAKRGEAQPAAFGNHSDFDVAVVSAALFDVCRIIAPGSIRDDKLRTEPDPIPEIAEVSRVLGLAQHREVSIMVFKTRAAAQRSPGVRIA